ncbi:regulatory factor X [Mactra antiquata]
MELSITYWLERCLTNDQTRTVTEENNDSEATLHSESTLEDRKGTYTKLRSASKPHSTPLTLKWLEENYEIAEGVCIPRSTLYVHYLDYCEKHDTQPVNAASFGKIIRQQFPQLTTRRLGTRGQSKYHYYGIGVRETSKYYEVAYSSKGVQSSADGKKDNTKQIIAYSPRSKLGTLLPEFPDIKDVQLPQDMAEEKVQNFLLHFWQGMPTHIKSILECKTLVTLVGVCDSILYKAIANVLMPTVLQPLPESLTQVIRQFSVQLDEWLRQALDSLPECLQRVKFDLARDFEILLEDQSPLESYIEWLDNMVEQCVTKKCRQQPNGTPKIARQFLLMWSCIGTRVIRDMTLHSAPSFGSFHLLHLMFDEYVLYTVENLHNQDKSNDLLKAVKGEISLDILDDILLYAHLPSKPEVHGCSGSDVIDVQRSSVIRGVESSFSDNMDTPMFYPQTDPLCFQPHAMCSEQRDTSSHSQVLNQASSLNNLYSNQINCRQTSNRETATLYSMYPPQPPEVSSNQSNGVNVFDNFDWSSAGQVTQSTVSNVSLHKPYDQHLSVKTGSVMQLQSDIKQSSSTYFSNYGSDHINFKRHTGSHVYSKKTANEISDFNARQNMPDMYYHHVSNLI